MPQLNKNQLNKMNDIESSIKKLKLEKSELK